ncbi:hypothetical protein [uncultured Tateyamaria sp.]|uniref:hypothetical protein n=1 Tax=uncultured Tateyamaria sp. TaxID=455651 RepID=UPI0026192355|nr:hypothetical protein [uncultured Tateyamaria sp.]
MSLFGGAAILPLLFDDDDNAPVEGVDLEIDEGGRVVGPAGADTVALLDTVNELTLDTGTGDDTIQGSDAFAGVYASTIDAGAGDDLLELVADSATIYGGDGNDTMFIDGTAFILDAVPEMTLSTWDSATATSSSTAAKVTTCFWGAPIT